VTIRINLRTAPEGFVVELHGRLEQDVLGEFEKLCGSGPGPLRLDLSQLTGADEAGLAALRRKAVAGSLLEGASPYVRLLLGDLDTGRASDRQ